jgi:hypothetical protein
MAAVTFNPLVLSAKASVRGAAVRRAGAKASKRAAFAVKASDDDMDFMVRAAAFFRFPRRRADRRVASPRDRSPRRARSRSTRASSDAAPGRVRLDPKRVSTATDGCAVSNRRRTIRRFANAHPTDAFSFRFLRVFSIARGGRVVVPPSLSPSLSLATMSVSIRGPYISDLLDLYIASFFLCLTQGEIGLGEEMEDMLAKAAGGSSVPKFIKDTGNESLIQAFKFLGSDQMTGQGSELLFVEKYGETLYREAGFTETAEKINGRLAQVGFVLAVQNTFNGDVLTLMAKYPLLVFLVVAGVAGASIVPTANPQGYFPDALKGSVMKAYESAGLNDVFSEKAETINGRAAMLGMGIFLATAIVF